MHTRRSFLRGLAAGLLATKLAFELGAKAVESFVEEIPTKTVLQINPDWVNAPFEAGHFMSPEVFGELEKECQEMGREIADRFIFSKGAYPPRYILIDGNLVQVHPFIEAQVPA